MKFNVAIVVLSLMISACASSPGFPDWVNSPGDGVVGLASMHIQGVHAQRKLAIARARKELAASKGVSVESVTVIHEYENSQTAGSNSASDTKLSVSATPVAARVVEVWENPQSGDIYVHLMPL